MSVLVLILTKLTKSMTCYLLAPIFAEGQHAGSAAECLGLLICFLIVGPVSFRDTGAM